MLPLVGFSRATTRRRSVVLPAPDPPTMQVVSPCRQTRSIPRRTSVSPKLLRTSLSTTMSLCLREEGPLRVPSEGGPFDVLDVLDVLDMRALGPSLAGAGFHSTRGARGRRPPRFAVAI